VVYNVINMNFLCLFLFDHRVIFLWNKILCINISLKTIVFYNHIEVISCLQTNTYQNKKGLFAGYKCLYSILRLSSIQSLSTGALMLILVLFYHDKTYLVFFSTDKPVEFTRDLE
jgi:hypothetical protein